MATYLFAWNPAIWNWPELASDIRKLARRGHVDHRWSASRHRNIDPGSRAFIVRLGVPPKGIFGSGVTLTPPESAPHWIEEKAAAGVQCNYTTLRFDALFPMPLITFDELEVPPFRRYRWGIRMSGTYLPETIADALEDLWEARVNEARARPAQPKDVRAKDTPAKAARVRRASS